MTKLLLSAFGIILFISTSQAQVWTQKANFPGHARVNPIVFEMGGKGYLYGGASNVLAQTSTVYKDLWEYNPVTDTWIQLANSNSSGIVAGIGFSYNNEGYVGLGWDGSTNHSGIYKYSRTTNSWSFVTNYAGQGVRNSYFALVGNLLYVAAGSDVISSSTSIIRKDFWTYNLNTNQWIQLSDLPFGKRSSGISFSHGINLYFGFGTDGTTGNNKKDLWQYNTQTAVWTQIIGFPGVPRIHPTISKVYNKVIIGGGHQFGVGQELLDYYELDLNTMTWKSITSFTNGQRSLSKSIDINNKAYILCGNNVQNSALKDVWELSYSSVGLETIENIEFKIYPQPVSNQLFIESGTDVELLVQMYDLNGRVVIQKKIDNQFNMLDVTAIKSGMYHLKIISNQKSISKKIIISH
ncbi:MAG: T9SS C-terminal target domain-containing protein [Bacteroidetes bacterium]|nr:MAG: T9SS C-terminal target domain-containing protein [Bacteroidota bacterium]MBL1144635.1 T9SS C-terminal target domain-containing protein [Bacteroidota bacterium]NOG57430.1 T9SS type A sorting domain-containing protein [Bacteroidota bacterium]